jgi:TonB family protein
MAMLKKLINWKYCLLLVLLLHLLLLVSFSWTYVFDEDELQQKPEMDAETKADRVLPSYVYQEHPSEIEVPASQAATKALVKSTPTAIDGILKPKPDPSKNTALTKAENSPQQQALTKGGADKADPANLIADKETDKPLIKILSRATGKYLFYPKAAQDFHITGVVSIKFYLTPDGTVNQVSLLESSGSSQLDAAGLYAIRHISPVLGVAPYVPVARFLTVGIIFGG